MIENLEDAEYCFNLAVLNKQSLVGITTNEDGGLECWAFKQLLHINAERDVADAKECEICKGYQDESRKCGSESAISIYNPLHDQYSPLLALENVF